MLKKLSNWLGGAFILAYCLCFSSVAVLAETSQSSNYKLDESSIGSGGSIESSSTNYKASDATGDLVVGNTTSGNFQIDTGSKTTDDPHLSFSINNAAVDFGSFTATSPTVTTASFSVLNYTSYGYAVQIIGNTPTNSGHTIPAMTETAESQIGTEQFGLNLVANTSPTSVGANPNNDQFGFGKASTNYGTANKFRYVSGETIALAPKSSGLTTYTISYLINVASLTPGGKYTCDQTIIVTGTY